MDREKGENEYLHLIFNYISLSLLIAACILILVQSINNVKYNSNDKTSIAERLVYQQFSHDVYSNIKSKILYDFEIIDHSQNCSDNREIINIPIKIESFYDCEKVEVDDIDKDLCQNRISRTSTCCKKECCKQDIYTMQKICKNKNIYNSADNEDPRKDCKIFNIYNGKIYKMNNYKICARRYDYNYEYLLEKNQDSFCKGGITLDSLDHCFNENITILNQSNSNNYLSFKENSAIIVKNILSEINPNYFEYELIMRESILNNKIKIEEKEQNEVNKYKVININNIYNAFFLNVSNLDLTYGNPYYINQNQINLSYIMENNDDIVLNEFQDNNFIKEKNLNWYTRNYIGFKNLDELQKFKYYFDEEDPQNNTLYKMDKILFPNIESIVISSVFILLMGSIFLGQIYYCIKNDEDTKRDFYFNSFRRISTLVLFIIYLSIYLFKYLYYYHKIEKIDMEKYYAFVLEKYNERRKQKNLLIGIIFLKINLILEVIHYIYEYILFKNPISKGKNNPSNKTIICTLENSDSREQKKFKFYLNRKFSDEKKRFEKKYFFNYVIIECMINDEIIDEDKTISELELQNESIIKVICEPIEKEHESFKEISNS